jgi:hypothetical protein
MPNNTAKQVASEDVITIDASGLDKYLDAHLADDKLIEKLKQTINCVIEQDVSDYGGSTHSASPPDFRASRLEVSACFIMRDEHVVDILFDNKSRNETNVKVTCRKTQSKRAVKNAVSTLYFTDPQHLRDILLETATWLSAEVVSRRAGSTNINISALPNRWRKGNRVFAITHGSKDLFPDYIFGDDGKPLPVVSSVLKCFHDKRSIFKTALWFASKNSWLGGKAPKDMLLNDTSAVTNAAKKEVAENVLG